MRQITWFSLLLLNIFSCSRFSHTHRNTLDEKSEPYDLFAFQRSFPDRDFDWQGWRKAIVRARQQEAGVQARNAGCSGNTTPWTLQGPANIAGRVNTLAVKPDNEDVVLAGFSGGGIFKTIDAGENWYPVFDEHPELSIGHIAFDPNNPEVVYAGTGDPNIPSIVFNGDGIYKSTDGGEHWQYMGLSPQGIISKIQIDPSNSQVVYAATMGNPYVRNNERGIYKSTDGGANWQQALFVSDQAGASDLVINPANPQVLYASFWDRIRSNQESVVYGSHARVYKTSNGGADWTLLGGGLPTGVMGRTGLAISQQNPDKVYAVYIDSLSTPGGLYKTIDGGSNWTSVNIDALEDKCSDFGWYFGKIALNPDDDEEVYFHAIILWRKLAGSNTWSIASGGHADSHDIAFTPSGRRYWANDGGVYRNNAGQSGWTKCKNLPTTQFYRTNFNPHLPDTYFAGAQDNGITKGNGMGINNWVPIYAADGFRSAFHPDDPNTFWVEIQNGSIQKTTTGGDSWTYGQPALGTGDRCNWDAPFFLSKFQSDKLYAATYRVYFSSNGTAWGAISGDLTDGIVYEPRFHTISCLSESPVLEDKLLAGTSDGNVWRREPTTGWINITPGLPDRYVTSVHGSPTLQNRIFVTNSGFRDNDYIPHVHRSDNNGQNWQDISGDLPQVPVNDLFVLPGNADSVLFVATDAGVYFSLNSGVQWNRLGGNMPFIPVFDLEHNPVRKELVAATFARGIWTFPLDSVFSQQNTVVSISGTIRTELAEGVENVLISPQVTDGSGIFDLGGIPGCQEYTLAPYRNDFPLNGVSTYDLVLISKHILGIEMLDSPYKIIAADANKSQSVTTFDIVAIRKLILGIDTAFVGNTSWRFVPANHVFSDPGNPFMPGFPETLSVQLQTLPVTGSDFVALKVGDMNGSVIPAAGNQPLDRTEGNWLVDLEDKDMEPGALVATTISGDISDIAGVQFSLQFDPNALEFVRVEPLLPDISAGNFGYNRLKSGIFTTSFENSASWQGKSLFNTGQLRPLFRVVLKAKKCGMLREFMTIGEFPTPALAYRNDGTALKPVLNGSPGQLAVVCYPNPFGTSGVQIEMPEENEHRALEVYNGQGKLVLKENIPSKSQQIFLPASRFTAPGVYYYKIQGQQRYAGKLIYAP
ncbi:MAG: T9SS type A sorting domain-containing protein [Saprospiraceae bacterium]|nr:T9SS type A sorting domain-containing protein [Saprospiraceae bacterium]